MNFESSVKVESKVIEGAVFTLNKMTEGRRIKLRQKIAEPARRLSEILKQIAVEREKLETHIEQKKLAAENNIPFLDTIDAVVGLELTDKLNEIMDDEINPVYVRWGLKSVAGMTIDSKPATPDSVVEDGPRDFYAEVLQAVREAAGLSERQAGESAPLVTSAD